MIQVSKFGKIILTIVLLVIFGLMSCRSVNKNIDANYEVFDVSEVQFCRGLAQKVFEYVRNKYEDSLMLLATDDLSNGRSKLNDIFSVNFEDTFSVFSDFVYVKDKNYTYIFDGDKSKFVSEVQVLPNGLNLNAYMCISKINLKNTSLLLTMGFVKQNKKIKLGSLFLGAYSHDSMLFHDYYLECVKSFKDSNYINSFFMSSLAVAYSTPCNAYIKYRAVDTLLPLRAELKNVFQRKNIFPVSVTGKVDSVFIVGIGYEADKFELYPAIQIEIKRKPNTLDTNFMENVGEDVLRYAESRGINLKKAGQYVTCYYYDCQKNKTYSDNFFYKKTIAIK